ncbi:MAG: hypothetical protein QM296_00945 [Bacillota bacterium]|nr:hypothetical protein [Bacillota bacterium]
MRNEAEGDESCLRDKRKSLWVVAERKKEAHTLLLIIAHIKLQESIILTEEKRAGSDVSDKNKKYRM